MSFTVQEIETISNATLNHAMDRGKVHAQAIQNKPLLQAMEKKTKTFAASKEYLTGNAVFDYTTQLEGFSGDDSVSFAKPNNIKQFTYPYKRLHAGIEITFDELQKNGISVTESNTGRTTSEHSGREMEALANLMDHKTEDLMEGRARGLNNMFWRDGTADNELVPGIKSFILTNPSSATIVGGIDQSTNAKWRNRALLGVSAASPANSTIARAIQTELRQLVRYGSPKHTIFAGADMLDALENELRINGRYTDSGWSGKGSIDMSVADVQFKGVTINYDPTLDDEGEAKYMYILDMNAIYPMYMEGEKNKTHNPSRPHDKFVLYRSITDVCGLVCKQRNTSGIITIA